MKLTLYDTITEVQQGGYHRLQHLFLAGDPYPGVRHRPAIYAIYGFVRLADEIVDTFFGHSQREMLDRFRQDTAEAISGGVSSESGATLVPVGGQYL
jgi:hypothetical protein